jgi:hypothetical protein
MKQLLLALVITTVVSACATTTSPTGRRQMVGGVSQAQLDQLGAQAFAETKQKRRSAPMAARTATCSAWSTPWSRSCQLSTVAYGGRRRYSSTRNPTPSPCPAARWA